MTVSTINMHRTLGLCLLVLALSACGIDSGEDISGVWKGATTPGNQSVTLDITQAGNNLSGVLTFGGSKVDLTGTKLSNIITLSTKTTTQSLRVEASIEGNVMDGSIIATAKNQPTQTIGFQASR